MEQQAKRSSQEQKPRYGRGCLAAILTLIALAVISPWDSSEPKGAPQQGMSGGGAPSTDGARTTQAPLATTQEEAHASSKAVYTVEKRERVEASRVTTYYVSVDGVDTKENYRAIMKELGRLEEDYFQLTVHIYYDEADYERDEKLATGFAFEDGTYAVDMYERGYLEGRL